MAYDGLVQVHYGQRKRMYYLQHLAQNKCVPGALHKEDKKKRIHSCLCVQYIHIDIIVKSDNNKKVSGK